MPLPVVKPAVGGPIQREILSKSPEKFVKETMERLLKDNPCIPEFIIKFAGDSKDPKAVCYAGLLVYRLLESQQEADDMMSAS